MTTVDPKDNITSTETLFKGRWGSIDGIVKGGDCLVRDYLATLKRKKPAEHKKVIALLEHTIHNGPPSNEKKFKSVRDKILEFKSYQERLLCFFDGAGRIIITHGVTKKRDELPRAEIERAIALRAEFLQARGSRSKT